MTKQQQTSKSSGSATPVAHRRVPRWIGPVALGALAFVGALLLLQPGSLPVPWSNSEQSGAGLRQTAAGQGNPTANGGGNAGTGLGTRLAQTLDKWRPHWGGNSPGNDSTVSDGQGTAQASSKVIHAQWASVPPNAAGAQFATPQNGEPPADHATPLGGTAGGGGAVSSAAASSDPTAGSAQSAMQHEKVGRGLSARSGGGVEVDDVPAGSIAGQLGLQSGDVILSVNGNTISSPEDLAAIYQRDGAARQVEIIRAGRVLHRH